MLPSWPGGQSRLKPLPLAGSEDRADPSARHARAASPGKVVKNTSDHSGLKSLLRQQEF